MEATTLAGRSMIFAGGIGVATPEAKTSAEAMQAGGLDWKVKLVDAGYVMNDGTYAKSRTGKKAVVRVDKDDNPVHDFGFVGRRYSCIQNTEMFDWCDRLVDDYGAKYEAAWSLYGGSEVGLTMKFPETVKIGGEDPYEKYLLLRARHDGTGSVVAAITDVRLYCTNMLNVAVKGAVRLVRVPHLTNATQKLAAARETFELTFKYDEVFNAAMEKLIEKKLTDDRFAEITKTLLMETKFGGIEEKVTDILALRETSSTLQDQYRQTAYGAFQAIAEWADWSRETKSAQGRVIDLLDGRVLRLKNNALAALS